MEEEVDYEIKVIELQIDSTEKRGRNLKRITWIWRPYFLDDSGVAFWRSLPRFPSSTGANPFSTLGSDRSLPISLTSWAKTSATDANPERNRSCKMATLVCRTSAASCLSHPNFTFPFPPIYSTFLLAAPLAFFASGPRNC
jgi:hypothetical protein